MKKKKKRNEKEERLSWKKRFGIKKIFKKESPITLKIKKGEVKNIFSK